MKPSEWGPPVWNFLHSISNYYPANPSEAQQAAARSFFQSIRPSVSQNFFGVRHFLFIISFYYQSGYCTEKFLGRAVGIQKALQRETLGAVSRHLLLLLRRRRQPLRLVLVHPHPSHQIVVVGDLALSQTTPVTYRRRGGASGRRRGGRKDWHSEFGLLVCWFVGLLVCWFVGWLVGFTGERSGNFAGERSGNFGSAKIEWSKSKSKSKSNPTNQQTLRQDIFAVSHRSRNVRLQRTL